MARICVLLPHHWGAARGGAELQAHLLAEYLQNTSSHEVVYLARYVPAEVTSYRYEIRRFGKASVDESLRWGNVPFSLGLYAALKDLAPDVILHMVASSYTGVAAFYARRHGAILYWYIASDMDVEPFPNVGVRSPMRHLDRIVFRYGVRRAHYVISQTRAQSKRLEEKLGLSTALQIGNFFGPPKAHHQKSATFTVLWIANLKGLKRPDLFLELAKRVSAGHEIEFRMAGRASEAAQVRMVEIASTGLSRFQYLGELSLDEVETELSRAHLLVNTSDYEGFPNTFIQAWLQEVPVYSLNVDPDGLMEAEGIGRRLGSIDRLCEAVATASKNLKQVAEMGVRAKKYALLNHSMSNANRILAHLDEQLAKSTATK